MAQNVHLPGYFIHEHGSGEDQLYLAVHLKFNSKSHLMLW